MEVGLVRNRILSLGSVSSWEALSRSLSPSLGLCHLQGLLGFLPAQRLSAYDPCDFDNKLRHWLWCLKTEALECMQALSNEPTAVARRHQLSHIEPMAKSLNYMCEVLTK